MQIDGKSKDAEGGWKQLLLPLIAVTILGGAGGGFLGFSVLVPKGPTRTEAAGTASKETGETGAEGSSKQAVHGDAQGSAHGGGHDEAKGKEAAHQAPAAPAQLKVKELPPVVANLGGKERAWVRIQSAIVYDPHELEHVDTLIPVLLSDITAFIGTLELSAIEGPDGLRRLQEELNERASTRSERHIRELIIEAAFIIVLLFAPSVGLAAEGFDLNAMLPNGGASTSGRMIQVLGALTILSIAPGLLVMVTSFTRFAIALSFLRAGLGLQSTPANLVMVSLALFMTFYVMAPSGEKAWETGVRPLVEGKISEGEAFNRISEPFRQFMLANVREKDLRLFEDLRKPDPATSKNGPRLDVLVPAFMTSELRRGFEIGFLIVVPFLAIDIIVAIITMSMGMMMLPPTTIALPAKILFFILIDGWNLLIGSLIRSFG